MILTRSHHSLSQNLSCGGWGEDQQTKRTCEIFSPLSGWEIDRFYLARPNVEHTAWIFQPFQAGQPRDFPRLLLMSGNSTEIVTPGSHTYDLDKDVQLVKHHTRSLVSILSSSFMSFQTILWD